MAWQAYKRDLHTCGRPLSESMTKANQFAYEAEIVRCHACAAQDRVAQKYRDNEDNDPAGVLVRLTKTP